MTSTMDDAGDTSADTRSSPVDISDERHLEECEDVAEATSVAELLRQGWERQKQRRFQEALSCADQALTQEPDNASAARLRVASLAGLRRFQDVVVACERPLELQPDSAKLWRLKGMALYELRRTAEALASFERALALGDQLPEIRLVQARCFLSLSRYEEALSAAVHARKNENTAAGAWDVSGEALAGLQRYKEAFEAYSRAAALSPQWTRVILNQATVAVPLARYTEALELTERVLGYDPDNYLAWTKKAGSLFSLQRHEEALDAWKKAQSLRPEIGWNRLWMARCLCMLGRFTEALVECVEAIATDPQNAALREDCLAIARLMRRDTVDHRFQLKDGRWLGYLDIGDPAGAPLMYFHGTPGSRLVGHFDAAMSAPRIRVIIPDRPGYGLSTYKRHRKLLDWPDDVAQLANHLGVERFAVLGVSGGGAYALACAARMPDRVTRVGLVSSAAPPELIHARRGQMKLWLRERFTAALPMLLVGGITALSRLHAKKDPESYYRFQMASLAASAEERKVALERKEVLFPNTRESLLEPFRQGSRGFAKDSRLVHRKWGLALNTISTPVWLWHGECDGLSPVAKVRALAAILLNCQATYYPGEGHDVINKHEREILSALVEAPARDVH